MVIPNFEDRSDVINYLNGFDCCPRCILRFLDMKGGNETYVDPESTLKSILNVDPEVQNGAPSKKLKRNPCRVCLDILQDSTIATFSESIKSSNINEYQYSDFVTCVSFPKSVMIRNHSMWLLLKEKFPKVYTDPDSLDSLSKIFKIASTEIISAISSKVFNAHSNFSITFDIEYEDDESEIQNIRKLQHLLKKGKQQVTSRAVILQILEKCDATLFKENFSVPPSIPSKEPVAKICCLAEPMWIGGRYLKFSREMGQTPWIIYGKVMTKYNIQDIIFDSMEKVMGFDKKKLTFCASGREDADVRMLGNGRPFYVQIDDPKRTNITFAQCRAIENLVFNSGMAAVVKMQKIAKSTLRKVKEGEEHKRKHYYALCQIGAVDVDEVLRKINIYKNQALEVFQKTPLRVLHRRSLAVRKKYIYNMEAKVAAGYPDLIEVKLVTQAGTYVKEFVNGDFQRTQPSLTSMLNIPIDIVALDVTNIELCWPEE